MSSQNKPNPQERFDYVVQVPGPITINGTLRRKGDTVRMTAAAAKSYGHFVKRAAKAVVEAPKKAKA